MFEIVFKTEIKNEVHRKKLQSLIDNFNIPNAEIVKQKFINNILYLQVKIKEQNETRAG